MKIGRIDVDQLMNISKELGEVVSEPARWPDFLDQISRAVYATGAALLPSESTADFPISPSVREAFEEYLKGGWHERDPRRRGIEKQLRGEVVADDDVITLSEMLRSDFYNEFMPHVRLKWWAGIGLRAGPELWCLSLQRSAREGQFTPSEKSVLQEFSTRLTEIASLSYMIGNTTIANVAAALDYNQQAALAVDYTGRVVYVNSSAEALLNSTVRVTNGMLMLGDHRASLEYENLLGRLRWTPEGVALKADPIIVQRANACPLILQVLPIDSAVRASFQRARALLLLKEVQRPTAPAPYLIGQALGISAAEAKLAALIAAGETVETASEVLGITRATARTQLSSIYAKTDIRTQSGLVALLASLPGKKE